MQNESEDDTMGFLKSITQGLTSERREKPFVGLDECFNRLEIVQLTHTLLQRGLIDCSSPLWYQPRERDGAIIGTFLGSVDKDSSWRTPNPLISDVGVPVKHQSWSDLRVVQMLVAQFVCGYNKVVLLSENTRNNEGGLRRLLNNDIKPWLDKLPSNLSLTALFKKGKTNINNYCREVSSYFEQGRYQPGYREVLL